MQIKQFAVIGYDNNFSYLIWEDNQGAVIDPGGDIDMVCDFADQHNITILYIINTHGHHDHIEQNQYIIDMYGAQVIAHKDEPCLKDIQVQDGQIMNIGKGKIKFIHTPGHTEGSMCIYFEGNLITGDTLFVNACGRCDLPGSNIDKMYHSLFEVIGKLPDDTKIYPGHDYGDIPVSTLKREKEKNKYYQPKSKESFLQVRGLSIIEKF